MYIPSPLLKEGLNEVTINHILNRILRNMALSYLISSFWESFNLNTIVLYLLKIFLHIECIFAKIVHEALGDCQNEDFIGFNFYVVKILLVNDFRIPYE